jgi:uncharacterized protein with GYD domain
VPTYIMLGNWTDQGAQKVKDSPRRVDAAKRSLTEAPDDAVAARFTLLLGQLGAVRTRTMKAFPEAAYREIVASLG